MSDAVAALAYTTGRWRRPCGLCRSVSRRVDDIALLVVKRLRLVFLRPKQPFALQMVPLAHVEPLTRVAELARAYEKLVKVHESVVRCHVARLHVVLDPFRIVVELGRDLGPRQDLVLVGVVCGKVAAI